jgi:hypothetical protein
LIVSSSHAAKTHDRVAEALRSLGWDVAIFLSDMVLNGNAKVQLRVDDLGAVDFSYDGVSIGPRDVAAAWYWKVSQMHLYEGGHDLLRTLSIDTEMARVHSAIWSLYRDELWLGAPSKLAQAEAKLTQLVTAHRVGFSIPETLVTNDWEQVKAMERSVPALVVKMFKGLLADSTSSNMRATYTTPVDAARIEALEADTVPYPGMFQPFIGKAREWRVTVVGDEVFAAAIETQPEAKDDWRRLQLTPAVAFLRADLPPGIADLCVAYLVERELRYGAFDFIETPEGKMVFLECNPAGQYGWVETELGLPISEAIAHQLDVIGSSMMDT